eukprot:12833079-Heterocapsa_arctica.AAC.1
MALFCVELINKLSEAMQGLDVARVRREVLADVEGNAIPVPRDGDAATRTRPVRGRSLTMVLAVARGGELAHHIPEPLTSPRRDVHVIGEIAAAAAHDVVARAKTPTGS